VTAINHFVPVLHRGDAIGRHTLRLRDATRARGVESHIYVDVVEEETADQTIAAVDYPATAEKGDVVVYQFATASFMAPWLASRDETLVVNYHNITPPDLLAPWDNHLALGQLRAQADLRLLAPRTSLAVSDSSYNQAHLVAAGFAATAVIPPSAALGSDVIGPASEGTGRAPNSTRGARWLTVGRVAPNKSLQDTIAALAVTRARHDPDATLLIIGKPATALYDQALHRYVADLGLTGAVTFSGHAGDTAVAAAYAQSDVLVITSEHEGFCVPAVEAMSVGLPVVAFAQGALPEVLGSAGTFVTSKDPYSLAATINELLADGPRRAALSAAARQQLHALDLDSAAERFVTLLLTLTGAGAGAR
jgi:glycosyltransferase involved in cell wall biosynthesis